VGELDKKQCGSSAKAEKQLHTIYDQSENSILIDLIQSE
jgi:hypothetical protein